MNIQSLFNKREVKTKNLNIRVTPTQYQVILEKATEANQSVTEFLVSALIKHLND